MILRILQLNELYTAGRGCVSGLNPVPHLSLSRGGASGNDQSHQEQEGPPVAAGHAESPGQEADLHAAVSVGADGMGSERMTLNTPPLTRRTETQVEMAFYVFFQRWCVLKVLAWTTHTHMHMHTHTNT